ncbi:protein FAR1-RELATED SEQUENCE 5-like [Bidens hawaiensis]|uniref:protein FAR1-RELATED SEQUENCE 5-like n=1 Tax=Bidens hawaiensis TaxID=980011 RepID=UPI004049370D
MADHLQPPTFVILFFSLIHHRSYQHSLSPIVPAFFIFNMSNFKDVDELGSRTVKEVDTLSEDFKGKKQRRKPSQRTNCETQIRLILTDNGMYRVKYFGEAHNHPFFDEDAIHFLKSARELTSTDKKMLDDLANINIGPVKAFNIMRTMYGGFDKVGATKSDCKNYKRSINLYIGDYDAEMVVQRLMAKKEFCPNFSCDYSTTTDVALKGLFWADERAKMNFYVFGDVFSFDATYRHNKYNLVFVPFTGIDNHNRNVTLGSALLGSETAKSYTWFLNCFKKDFGYAPAVVVTDQDPAMKRAIEDVFPNSRHRLCIWHIMDKLSGLDPAFATPQILRLGCVILFEPTQ